MGNLTTIGWDWCTPYYGMCDLYAWFFEGQNCVEMCIYLHKNLYMGSARPVKYGWVGSLIFIPGLHIQPWKLKMKTTKYTWCISTMVYKPHGV